MKKVKLKNLEIKNFKGIRKLEIKELDQVTNIYGDNATGKTTVFDAFTWLLFNKDSNERTAFEIKPLDENNQVVPKTENEVSAVLEIDTRLIPIRKIHKEKWVKKKGSLESEYTGNETLYFWDDVPVKKNEYESNIQEIVSEDVFKLITSPTAFNALRWQDQREMLVNLTSITDEGIAETNPEFKKLFSKLSETKTIDKYERQLKASIRESKKQINELPTRIDEVERGKPEALDFDKIKKELLQAEKEKLAIEKQIRSKLEAEKAKLDQQLKINQELHDIDTESMKVKRQLRNEAEEEANTKNKEYEDLKRSIQDIEHEITRSKKTIQDLNERLNELTEDYKQVTDRMDEARKEWISWNSREFEIEAGQTECPTCSREFEKDKIHQIIENAKNEFKINKEKELSYLNERGSSLATRKKSIEKEFETIEQRILKGNKYLDQLESDHQLKAADIEKYTPADPEAILQDKVEASKKIKELTSKRIQKEKHLKDVEGPKDKEMESSLHRISETIQDLKTKLATKDAIARADERIKEIKEEESTLAQVIADHERELHTIEQFTQEKINRLENAINEKFKYVKFKLFETQVNGSEVPTCKSMVNGVPYSDVNTAGRINAGLDIINTLTKHYGVTAPIFIDNRESITETIDTDSQIINLIVKPGQKELEVK